VQNVILLTYKALIIVLINHELFGIGLVMSNQTKLSVTTKVESNSMLQTLMDIPYAILKISDEELRIAIANTQFLTDPKNFIRSHQID
jgi:hypothetical protein